ncbi:hypothetical protein [uncultured Tateyamaria sp.]|uniref:hypothetical protein n=1 Tax=uncultured Tateyamaria sp. TaxID=455651 RepID=UPI0026381DC9|nr:hypothetical protein [uncultured Tateyamaria sp.]
MKMNLDEVPLGARRRASQMLESIRGTDMDPTKGRAALSGEVNAVFRPDLKDVAYFEFVVDLGRERGRNVAISGRGEEVRRVPARHGFIIASSDTHDHPISHWSLDREPPSHQLALAAKEKGAKVARLFKLDALSYAGEAEDGEMVAQTGQLPMPIDGLLKDVEKMRGKISGTMARPASARKNDEVASKEPHEVRSTGQRRQQTKIGSAGSWKELRDIYGETFGPLLSALRQQAASAWEIEELVAELGEGIMTGTTHKVALLEADANVEVSGDGAGLVKVEVMPTTDTGGCVVLHVTDEKLREEVSFDLHISYRSGLQEHLHFFAVSPTTPSNTKPNSGMAEFEE